MVEQRESARVSVTTAEKRQDISYRSGAIDEKGSRPQIGVLEVEFPRAAFLPYAIRNCLGLGKDDRYLEIHVPNLIEASKPQQILRAFRNSFELLAEYMKREQIVVKCLLGITHERLAKAAKFFGFDVIKIDDIKFNSYMLGRINQGYVLTPNHKKGRPMGDVLVCYQQTEKFMARFGTSGN